MDRRSNADEAVLIREECEFARLSNVGLLSVTEQVELKINVEFDMSTGDEIAELD